MCVAGLEVELGCRGGCPGLLGVDLEGWRACAQFGVLGMPITQAYVGLGLGLTSLLAVMEGLG